MPPAAPDTAVLLSRAAHGDAHARDELLDRHRLRLKRMIAVRMDHRLLKRVDPSDIVQETLILANPDHCTSPGSRAQPRTPALDLLECRHFSQE